MTRFLLRRIAVSLLLFLLVLTFVFFLLRLIPGSPVQISEERSLSEAQRQNLRRIYGLDQPLWVQYETWLRRAASGDLGTSISQQRPVATALREAFPPTAALALAALTVEYGVGLLAGLFAARRPGSGFDHTLRVAGLVIHSLPVFWFGLMAILVFAYAFPLFPASHMRSSGAEDLGAWQRTLDLAHHLALPALVLGLANAGGTARVIRGRFLEVLGQDYIRTARASGLSERRVLGVHALINICGPIVQLLSLSVPALLSGTLVTEIVFAWPGLGRMTFNALLSRDYPLILAAAGLTAGLVLVCNLAADLALAAIDPAVRDA
jgi:peptide/nickel transport system permease protein